MEPVPWRAVAFLGRAVLQPELPAWEAQLRSCAMGRPTLTHCSPEKSEVTSSEAAAADDQALAPPRPRNWVPCSLKLTHVFSPPNCFCWDWVPQIDSVVGEHSHVGYS